ncbi:alpha/beta hydrolase fold domain-containing protein [Parvularcula sp. ZS-1/3]|uniref:Alpha/beta hydrolase fold domain-containing protein n=1 Tax=Parvularcula mediterranea TaxID=2732508 RepID=A0A7Y3RLA0_9PROT|nr:alpha/beta hydrolase [Parvularcula mediterranea]NNU15675.1 alpha/beta hydrolase fold domain-containing protein [Parvularcula mediterranea]
MDRGDLEKHIAAHPVKGAPALMREAFEAMARPATVDVPQGRCPGIQGLDGLLFGEHGGAPILFLHGGGFVFGSPESHAGLASVLAKHSGRDVLALRYPLAPEALWPRQKNAVLDAIDRMSDAYGYAPALAGISAGGQLALIAATERVLEAVVAFSPNTARGDARASSRRANAEADLMNDPEMDARLADMAIGEEEAGDPDQNLALRDLSLLPPCYLSVGTGEVLLDDSLIFAVEAARAGAPLTLSTREGFHMEELFAPVFAPGEASIARAAAWLSSGNTPKAD